MAEKVTLRTQRLILRSWNADDRAAFAALNADPRVTATRLPPTSPIVRHVLYRITRDAFAASNAPSSAFDSARRST